jgi:NAD(P)-dependent dehydrogenase (short-subunit alcohol dehydrogenase family)
VTLESWSLLDMPDLTGTRALVTGATNGLGRRTAFELARSGAEVVVAARDPLRLEQLVTDLRLEVPDPVVHPMLVNLADLTSVRYAAVAAAAHGPLNLLVNNAGVMGAGYHRTVDGFELQLGTNHFGHFALTGLLLPRLLESGDARVVTVASQAHRLGRKAPLGDPRVQEGRYRRWHSYASSKLANLLFTFELDRRAHAAGLPLTAHAAHPGHTATRLMDADQDTGVRPPSGWVLAAAFGLLGQPAELGALPTLMAATAELPPASYVGPRGFAELRGMPHVVRASERAQDAVAGRRLWELSEQATGISYL